MDLKKLKTSDKLETEGVWVDIDATTKLKIARFNNPSYKKIIQQKLKPYRSSLRAGTLPDAIMEKALLETISETILLGWEGLQENDADVPYSVEASKRFLTDYPDFRDLVTTLATEADLFRTEDIEAAEKN